MSGLCVVFDLDDTLYPEASYARSGLRAAGHWAEVELGLAGIADELVAAFDAGRRGDLFDRVLASRDRAGDAATIARLIEVYRAHEPELALFEDAVWALAHYGASCPLALLTDGFGGVQQAKVAALGIAPRFRHLVFTDTLGGRDYWKPNPAGFQTIERAVPEASDFVYIGDNAAKDFVAPNALGWRTVRIVRPFGEYRTSVSPAGGEPHATIPTLMRLPEILGS